MRAFAESTPDIIHAKVNVSEEQSRPIAAQYQIRAVPAYRLINPKTQEVLYQQTGGSPDGNAITAQIKKGLPASSP